MTKTLKGTLAAATALALAAPALAQGGDNQTVGGAKFVATLTPTNGSTGAGLFEARINPGIGRICYTLSAGNIADATAAHLHLVAEPAGGVLTLDTPDDGDDDSEECQDIDRSLAQAIVRNPSNYFVDVHTEGGGVLRGTLGR